MNIYGVSASPLHGGNPTDRFVADWWIRKPHVERRIAPRAGSALRRDARSRRRRCRPRQPREAGGRVARVRRRRSRRSMRGAWLSKSRWASPTCCRDAPDLALAWRMATREIFTTYFAPRLPRGGVLPRSPIAQGRVSAGQAGLKACTTEFGSQLPAPSLPYSFLQRDHRIDAHRAARRHDPGHDGERHRRGDHGRERRRIGGAGVEQQAGDQAAARQRSADADQRADPGQRRRRGAALRRTPIRGWRPSASRTPISGMRWLTEYQIDP